MKKIMSLMVAALALGAASAQAANWGSDPDYRANKYFQMWVDVKANLVVNFYYSNSITGNAVLLGNSDASQAGGGTWSHFSAATNGVESKLDMSASTASEGERNSHLGVVYNAASNGLPAWTISLATDNNGFTTTSGNDRGGLIKDGATTGDNNRIPLLYKSFVSHPTETYSTEVPGTWAYVNDANDANWGANKLGYNAIAKGNGTSGNIYTGNNQGGAIAANEFFAAIGALVQADDTIGSYRTFPQVVLYAQ